MRPGDSAMTAWQRLAVVVEIVAHILMTDGTVFAFCRQGIHRAGAFCIFIYALQLMARWTARALELSNQNVQNIYFSKKTNLFLEGFIVHPFKTLSQSIFQSALSDIAQLKLPWPLAQVCP